MKKNHSALILLFLVTYSLFFTNSCDNTLIPSSTPLSVNDGSRSGAPSGITASHGMANVIQLSWQPVNGASRYYIYGTAEPTPKESDFVQVNQTTDTTVNIKVKSGATAWYKIAAVDSSFCVGEKSVAVKGSSLAKPEITEIISKEIDDEISMTIQWYMSNCNDETYRSAISYQISCKDDSGKDNSVYIAASSLTENSYTFNSLNPHTKYTVQVTAVNNNYGDTESSPQLTEETLHRLRPTAPEDIAADEGKDTSKINITFTLPDQADVYYEGDKSYINIPLYFKIYRKSENESSWTEMDEHFGTADVSDSAHPFKSVDGTSLSTYSPGAKVIWTDSLPDAYRGKRFEYKVQSFIDKTKLNSIMEQYKDTVAKNYSYVETSETKSISIAKGWTMAVPKLSVKDYNAIRSDESSTTYSSATVGFAFSWDNFAENKSNNIYDYILTKKYSPFPIDSSKQGPADNEEIFNSIESLNLYTDSFKLPEHRGKYIYAVYIVAKDEKNTGAAFDNAKSGLLTVTDNAGTIENFSVKGGYTDRFLLQWKNNPNCSYTLSYTQSIDGVSDGSIYYVDISSATTSGGTKTFVHTNEIPDSGVSRVYTLSAEDTTSLAAPISSTSEEVFSLGKPEVYFDETNLSYDTITVSWKNLPAAEKYSIYLDGTEKISELSSSDERIISKTDSSGIRYCSFTFSREEIGSDYYSNAFRSGKNRSVIIKAISSNANAAGSTFVKTLGPADIGLVTSVAEDEKFIKASWNKINGIPGYILQRCRYRISGSSYIKDEDAPELFYINQEDKSIQTNSGESISPSAMNLSEENGKLILKDNYQEVSESEKSTASQRQITQSKIPWGIPIEYTIIPVLSNKDSYSNGKLKSSLLASDISYTSVDTISKKGSAIGYGMNVHASKSDSSSSVKLQWDKPYLGNSKVRPYIYRRPKGSSDQYSDSAGVTISDTSVTSSTIKCTSSVLLKNEPYEYAVKYITTGSDMQNPFVQSYLESLADDMDELSPTEQKNVGYPFTLTGLAATAMDSSDNESFTTTVAWDQWNYTKRALGPEDTDSAPAYTLWTKNLNVASGWFQIGAMTSSGTVTSVTKDWYDTSIVSSANCLALTPNNVTETTGENKGLMRTQRDQKQYYMIRSQRKNSDGKMIYTYIGLDGSIYAYRKLSCEEFTKNILLIVADAFDQSGISDNTKDYICYGSTGKFINNHQGGTKNFWYGTNGENYIHIFNNLPGQLNPENNFEKRFTSSFTISMEKADTRSACDSHTLYYMPTGTIKVKHKSGQDSYSGTIVFTAGEIGKQSITALTDSVKKSYKLSANVTLDTGKNSTIAANTLDEMKDIFPFDLFQDRSSGTSVYNPNHTQYTGKWWDIKTDDTPTREFVEMEDE